PVLVFRDSLDVEAWQAVSTSPGGYLALSKDRQAGWAGAPETTPIVPLDDIEATPPVAVNLIVGAGRKRPSAHRPVWLSINAQRRPASSPATNAAGSADPITQSLV